MKTRCVVALLVALLPIPAFAQGQRSAVAVTSRFAFYSDFDTNLNDALIQAGLLRSGKGTAPELFRAGAEADCFQKLAPSVRAGWNEAVDYYAQVISPADWVSRQQQLIRLRLAGMTGELAERDREFLGLAAAFRTAASPAYRACRWTTQDQRNRKWIDHTKALLGAHEDAIASRLEALYQNTWRILPITVDVVETVGWSGANSTAAADGRIHLLISPSYAGFAALEIVFHEASHLIMGRESPVQKALDAAVAKRGEKPREDLWHVVLFFTTGEAVRRRLAETGASRDYRPLVFGIFDRGAWSNLRGPVERVWPAYIDGKMSLADAAAALMAAFEK